MAITIDDAVSGMYAAISFRRGEKPDWKRDRELFLPNARLVRITDGGRQEFGLESFEQNVEGMIASGELPEFSEIEIARETRQFGDMAHVWSAYESRRKPEDHDLIGRGINSIQLIRVDGDWRIHSMTWFRESEKHPLPTSS